MDKSVHAGTALFGFSSRVVLDSLLLAIEEG